MLATVSPLPARTVVRRVTGSGVSPSWPLSARCEDTSWLGPERGTISAEPALIPMRGGHGPHRPTGVLACAVGLQVVLEQLGVVPRQKNLRRACGQDPRAVQ